jgi:hypothetical protein
LNTNMNTVMHEYCLALKRSTNGRFPPVHMRNYLDYVSGEVSAFQDPALKADMQALIQQHRSTWERQSRTPGREFLGLPALLTSFASVDAALQHAVQCPRARNWLASHEEAHCETRLAFGAQESWAAYLRPFIVRAHLTTRNALSTLDNTFHRYIGWRLK